MVSTVVSNPEAFF